MSVTLTPDAERVRAVSRLSRGPILLLMAIAAFFGFAGLYIGWFGTRWGLLLLVPALAVAAGSAALIRRTRAGRAALTTGHAHLALDENGAVPDGAAPVPWQQIERIDLLRAPETPLDALPPGSRATVMNAGGTRGRWTITLRDGAERTGRFDFVPTQEYHGFLVAGRDLARAGGAVLLDRQDGP